MTHTNRQMSENILPHTETVWPMPGMLWKWTHSTHGHCAVWENEQTPHPPAPWSQAGLQVSSAIKSALLFLEHIRLATPM